MAKRLTKSANPLIVNARPDLTIRNARCVVEWMQHSTCEADGEELALGESLILATIVEALETAEREIPGEARFFAPPRG